MSIIYLHTSIIHLYAQHATGQLVGLCSKKQVTLSANLEILISVQASIKGFKLPGQHVVTLSRVGLAPARLWLKDTTKDETRYKINK